jgi:uncharacterized protein (DUF305 family)
MTATGQATRPGGSTETSGASAGPAGGLVGLWRGTPRRARHVGVAVAVIVALLLAYAGGVAATRPSYPSDTSPEAGFARDMSDHHAQAVELGMIAYARATRADVRMLGGDIALTQQGQIGVMSTWLKQWGLGPTAARPPMAWMPAGQRELVDNRMPGLASPDQMATLRAARGTQVDILFCQYMLNHHLGGIHMVDGILALTTDPDVRALAQAMHDGQTNEVQTLRGMLASLGATPL